MSRNTPTALKTEFSSENLSTLLLVKIDFSSGIQRYHSGVNTILYDEGSGPEEYLGVGTLGAVDPIEESMENQAHGINITLSGVDTTQLNLVVEEDYQGRQVDLFVAHYDIELAVIVDAQNIFTGGIDTIAISKGVKGSMTMQVEHESAQYDTPNTFRATDEDHQKNHPGDLFFDQIHNVVENEMVWGDVAWEGVYGEGNGSSGGRAGRDPRIFTRPH